MKFRSVRHSSRMSDVPGTKKVYAVAAASRLTWLARPSVLLRHTRVPSSARSRSAAPPVSPCRRAAPLMTRWRWPLLVL